MKFKEFLEERVKDEVCFDLCVEDIDDIVSATICPESGWNVSNWCITSAFRGVLDAECEIIPDSIESKYGSYLVELKGVSYTVANSFALSLGGHIVTEEALKKLTTGVAGVNTSDVDLLKTRMNLLKLQHNGIAVNAAVESINQRFTNMLSESWRILNETEKVVSE